jgi:hypothetical protein
MAKPHYYHPGAIQPHPRVKHKALDTRTDEYVGEGADLVAAGVLTPEMLPPRVSWSWRPSGHQRQEGGSVSWMLGYVTVTKVPERGYRVVLTVSQEEQARRREAAERREAEREQQRISPADKREPEHARRSLSNLTSSHEEFRSWYASFVSRSIRNDIKCLNEHLCCEGFTMSEETLAEFFEAVDEAVDLLRHGTSVFRQQERTAYINELRARMAKGDETFKPFLSRVLQPLPDGQ